MYDLRITITRWRVRCTLYRSRCQSQFNGVATKTFPCYATVNSSSVLTPFAMYIYFWSSTCDNWIRTLHRRDGVSRSWIVEIYSRNIGHARNQKRTWELSFPKSSLSMRKCTHPFPFFIDIAEPEVIHFQDVELLAHIFENAPPFILWLQQKKNWQLDRRHLSVLPSLLFLQKKK